MIILVGMPGCGKSTIGRLLARRLGLGFVDADLAIEPRLGCSIRSYFESNGESAFRDVEQALIADLTADPRTGVLATGGGAILREANRLAMRAAGHVVYLRATPEEIVRRVRHDTKRPLLQVENPLLRLRSLLADRDALYREAAHAVVDAGHGSTASVVNLLAMQAEQAQWAPPSSSASSAS